MILNLPNTASASFIFSWLHAFTASNCPIEYFLIGLGDAPHRDNIISANKVNAINSTFCFNFSPKQVSSLRQGSKVYVTIKVSEYFIVSLVIFVHCQFDGLLIFIGSEYGRIVFIDR